VALSAALLVGPGAASPVPTKAEATKTTAEADRRPAAQAEASPAKASETVAAVPAEPRRTVRVVYVGPITAQ